MGRCLLCDGDDQLSHTCNYCGGSFCSEHRLPESHNCIAKGSAQTLGPDFNAAGDQQEGSKTTSRTEDEESGTDECHGCGREIDTGTKYCLSCRYSGPPSDTTPGDDSPPVQINRETETASEGITVADIERWISKVPLPFAASPYSRRQRLRWRLRYLRARVWSWGYTIGKTAAVSLILVAVIAYGPISVGVVIPGEAGEDIDDTLQEVRDGVSSFAANLSTTGTDTDGDRLDDRAEERGETSSSAEILDANPNRTDLYIQVHHADGIQPLSEQEKRQLKQVWRTMPIENPDGSTGVEIHIDDGPPYAGPLGESVKVDDQSAVDDLRNQYYTEAYLGNRMCTYHQVVLMEIDSDEYAGYGSSPGMFTVVDGTTTSSYSGTVSVRVRGITHELLHNIVGEVPEEARGVDRFHTTGGWLSGRQHSGDLAQQEYLPKPVADNLSENGFVESEYFEREVC